MDNDSCIKKNLSAYYRKLKLKLNYMGEGLDSEFVGNQRIGEAIKSGKPFMCVRLGAVESRCVDKWMHKKNFSTDNLDQIYYAAGVFPQKVSVIEEFCNIYTQSLQNVDLLGVWGVVGERKILKEYCSNIKLIPLRSIEPYYHSEPWSKELKDKKVLIVHPFVDSIKEQYEKRESLFNNADMLPNFKNLILIKAIQSNAGGTSEFDSWSEALEFMKAEITKSEFDIAIVGAGAYGLPLAAHVKSLGKQAIQMAGSTQILFGIKGKRWDNHPFISKLYNENWIRPKIQETPPKINKVEGGSYW